MSAEQKLHLAQDVPMLPEGCGYQGYEFGAGLYPDSQCFGGRLYDMDNCDSNGLIYEPDDYIPCPMCHREQAIIYWSARNSRSGMTDIVARKSARSLVDDIRKNRLNGTEPWKHKALQHQMRG